MTDSSNDPAIKILLAFFILCLGAPACAAFPAAGQTIRAEDAYSSFINAGLGVQTPHLLTGGDYAGAPNACRGAYFSIPSACPECGGRIFECKTVDELQAIINTYLDPGNPLNHSWLVVKNNILLQLDGYLSEQDASRFARAIPGNGAIAINPPPAAASPVSAVALASSSGTPSVAPSAEPPTPTPAEQPVLQAISSPAPAPLSGEKLLVVSLSQQRLYAYQGTTIVYSFLVSTGQGGATRQGNFSILDKISDAYSVLWGFWMPDWMGIYYVAPDLENGIHALPILPDGEQLWGNSLGTPVTPGCIVLKPEDANRLFAWADIGTSVSIQS